MSLNILKTRKPHKDALYCQDEIAIISKYKKEYRQQTTQALRGHVFKTKMLVDIYNFWLAKGMQPVDDKESLKQMKVNLLLIIELLSFIHIYH